MQIAILGATGHIAKGMILELLETPESELTLFARNSQRVEEFLQSETRPEHCRKCRVFSDFSRLRDSEFDLVFNCVVNRSPPGSSKGVDFELFQVMEFFDNLVLDYLRDHENCRYVHFSSGAVYGGDYDSPIRADQCASFPINRITPAHYYQAVKLYSEARHRALPHRNIVDIRVFAYFSRFIDLRSSFLMAEVVSCLLEDRVFQTDEVDIVRDYSHPKDLFSLIRCCLQSSKTPLNTVLDIYSLEPVGKFRVLEELARRFRLKYEVVPQKMTHPISGIKPVYRSENRSAAEFGFVPQFTSLETIVSETEKILESHG